MLGSSTIMIHDDSDDMLGSSTMMIHDDSDVRNRTFEDLVREVRVIRGQPLPWRVLV